MKRLLDLDYTRDTGVAINFKWKSQTNSSKMMSGTVRTDLGLFAKADVNNVNWEYSGARQRPTQI